MMNPRIGYTHLGVPQSPAHPYMDWAAESRGLIVSNFQELEMCAQRRFMLRAFYNYVERFALPNSLLDKLVQNGRHEKASSLAMERAHIQMRASRASLKQEQLALAKAKAQFAEERERHAQELQRSYQTSESQVPPRRSTSESMSSMSSYFSSGTLPGAFTAPSASWFAQTTGVPEIHSHPCPSHFASNYLGEPVMRVHTPTVSEAAVATAHFPHARLVQQGQIIIQYPSISHQMPGATGLLRGSVYSPAASQWPWPNALDATPSASPTVPAGRPAVNYNHPLYHQSLTLNSLAGHRELLSWVNLQQVNIPIQPTH